MSDSPATSTVEVVEENPSAVHALAHVDQYLAIGKESGASDIHLSVNLQPTWRRFGTLEPIWLQADKLSAADTERLAMGFLNDAQKKLLEERGDVDFAYSNADGRYRTSVVRHRLGYDLVFRIIQTQVRTMDELGLPPQLKLLTQYQNGLVLVTGSIGSGKSTDRGGEPHTARTYHHARRPDRIPLHASRLPGQPARGAHAHRVVRRRPARCAPGGPGRHHGRGNARS